TGVSSRLARMWAMSQPTATPSRQPPTSAVVNATAAADGENTRPAATASAMLYIVSAVASFSRLSPSKIVTTRRGTASREVTAVAATASGGATMAPRTNATGHGRP